MTASLKIGIAILSATIGVLQCPANAEISRVSIIWIIQFIIMCVEYLLRLLYFVLIRRQQEMEN